MSERMPSRERAHIISNDEVIASLRANPENLSVLNAFLDAREAQVKTSKDALDVTMEVARMYRDAGLMEAAYEAFADAATQAWQEGREEAYKELVKELDTFET